MNKFVWLEEMTQQDVWKFAITMYGAQSVMIYGIVMVLKLSASSWDWSLQVRNYTVFSQYTIFSLKSPMYAVFVNAGQVEAYQRRHHVYIITIDSFYGRLILT